MYPFQVFNNSHLSLFSLQELVKSFVFPHLRVSNCRLHRVLLSSIFGDGIFLSVKANWYWHVSIGGLSKCCKSANDWRLNISLWCNSTVRTFTHSVVHSCSCLFGRLLINYCRDDTRFACSQWETALLCNDVSHWLGARLESALFMCSNHILAYSYQHHSYE